MNKTYRQCYAWGYECLMNAGITDARLDARLLLEFVCGTSQHDLLLHGDRKVETAQWQQYRDCIEKRRTHIPLQHITGTQDFMGFTFTVNEHVLIPRQDTEILVETALTFLNRSMNPEVLPESTAKHIKKQENADSTATGKASVRILDMCTGSGCILLSLLALAGGGTDVFDNESGISGIGLDISAEALKVARHNLTGISEQCGRRLHAEFAESDLFSALHRENTEQDQVEGKFPEKYERRFDMIVSNPPYIASKVIETLEPEVRLHEPLGALDGMSDGLYFYRRIITESAAFLKKSGALLFEIGFDQGEAVAGLMKEAGFSEVTVKQDYAGLDRVVYGFLEEEA